MIKCDKCGEKCDAVGVPPIAITRGDEDYNISIASQADGDLQMVDSKDLCEKCTRVWMITLLTAG